MLSLSVYYFEGILKISNVLLAVAAGMLAISLFKVSHKKTHLRPWKFLIVALVFFTLQEIFGALRAFSIFESPFITHLIPTVILVLLVFALLYQIHIDKFARKR